MTDKVNKVAEITVYFWIMKILATTLGETSGDLLSMTYNLGFVESLGITLVFFIVVLGFQLKSQKFHALLFWAVIVGTTSAGTEISDMMDRTLHLGYVLGSLILAAGLSVSLRAWYFSERNLEVYPIYEKKKEIFFWITVLFSNSLGTAFGDFLSDNAGLNYTGGALVCAAIIGVVLLLHYFTKINQVLLFWIAFVFTRPFGATFGDLLTKPEAHGGLNFSRGYASLATVVLLVLVLIYSEWKSDRSLKHAS